MGCRTMRVDAGVDDVMLALDLVPDDWRGEVVFFEDERDDRPADDD